MKRIGKPSPAMIVAIIALVVAIGGTAGALPGKESVKRNDLATGSVGARSIGRVEIERKLLVQSTDPTAKDGQYSSNTKVIKCPAHAPLAFDPYVSGLNEHTYVAGMRASQAGNRFKGPGSYGITIASDAGPGHTFTLRVNCLPRR